MNRNTALALGAIAAGLLFAGGDGGGAPVSPPPPGGGTDTPPPGGQHPALVKLNELTADTPTPGMLYQIVEGDTPITVARRALNVGEGSPETTPYLRATILVRYNWMLYAVQAAGAFSAMWPGTTLRGSLAAAFYPGNDDVRAAVTQGELPHRRYAWSRTPNPNFPGEFFPPTGNGKPDHGASGYGRIFLPFGPGAPDDPLRNPMALLVALGKTLADLNPNM